MINYTEKGAGLHAAIATAGHWLVEHDGVWMSDNDTAVQAIIDNYNPLPGAQLDAIALVDQAASDARGRYLTVGVGQDATYQLKLSDAQAVVAGGTPGPMISQEAAATGVIPLALAQTVVSTYAAWLSKAAQIEAARMGAKMQIQQATDWTTIAGLAATAVANLGAM